MLLITRSDDFGRLEADGFTIKHKVFPTSPRSEEEFEQALQAMHDVGLIELYDAGGDRLLQIVKFEEHQAGLHKRTASRFPPPPSGTKLSASEKDIETFVIDEIVTGRLVIEGWPIARVEQQFRIGNNYIDILAWTSDGRYVVFEIKRHRAGTSASEQLHRYVTLLNTNAPTLSVLIGRGADPIIFSDDLTILVFDDRLVLEQVSGAVKCRHLTSPTIPSELNRIEREQKGTERAHRQPAPTASPRYDSAVYLAYAKNEQQTNKTIRSAEAYAGKIAQTGEADDAVAAWLGKKNGHAEQWRAHFDGLLRGYLDVLAEADERRHLIQQAINIIPKCADRAAFQSTLDELRESGLEL